MKRFNLSEWAITHRALVLFMILLLGAAGIYSYLNLGRAEDPSFTIKTMVVQVGWPGATASDIQTQVADKIEKKLQQLPYLDRIESYSQPGVAFIRVTLIDKTPPSQVKELWYQVRKKVGDIRGDLPSGITGPNFNDEYGDVYSALYMLTADGLTLAELKARAEDIRQRLLRVADVNKVDIIGERPEKIFIEFSHAKLATLGVTPQQIFDSVAKQNAVVSGGSVETSADRINLRVTGAFAGVAAIAAVPVQADGRIFRLGDIATVKRGYEDPPSFLVRQGGKPALGLGVSMQDGVNIITLGENLQRAMKAIVAELPVGLEVTQIADQPHIVEESVSEFVKTFAEALLIVLVVSFLSLGWRTGIVVALSVPLVLAIVLLVMYAAGIDLHRITLGALIIALGLLVDDAIIAIEMMVVKMEQGWDRARAATYAWTSTAFPMLTGTLVTAAGFLPVGFAKSSAGEYAGGIFWIVGLALIASWIVAVLFTPYLGLKLLPDLAGKKQSRAPSFPLFFPLATTRCAGGASASRRHLRHTHLSIAAPRDRAVPALAQDRRRRHPANVHRGFGGLWARPAAILPDLDPLRVVLRNAAAGRHRHRRDRRNGQAGRAPARRRSGHRDLHDLCRTGLTAVLAGPQSGVAESRTSPRSSSSPETSRRASALRTGSSGRLLAAHSRRRAFAWTGSCLGRRWVFRCSSALSGRMR